MRRAARIDDGQQAIVDHLRTIGWRVHVTARLGGGFPDLAVTRNGITALVEVKDGAKPPSARRLTPAEVLFWQEWGCEPLIVLDPKDAEQKLTALLL